MKRGRVIFVSSCTDLNRSVGWLIVEYQMFHKGTSRGDTVDVLKVKHIRSSRRRKVKKMEKAERTE